MESKKVEISLARYEQLLRKELLAEIVKVKIIKGDLKISDTDIHLANTLLYPKPIEEA